MPRHQALERLLVPPAHAFDQLGGRIERGRGPGSAVRSGIPIVGHSASDSSRGLRACPIRSCTAFWEKRLTGGLGMTVDINRIRGKGAFCCPSRS